MESLQAEVVLPTADQLGEGTLWDHRRGELLRVDISAGLVHRWNLDTGAQCHIKLEPPVAFAIPRRDGGLVTGIGRRLVLLRDGKQPVVVADVEPGFAENRFNDAACDAAGRLWAGTMSTVRKTGMAALYRLEPDHTARPVVHATTISNGLGWSPAGDRLYFVDSTTQRVDVFDFDVASGQIADRRPFARVDPADGLPDGLAVDREGGVWVCLFGGGAVRRYDAAGQLDAIVRMPVSNPTRPAFGGPDLDVLYVASARHRLTAEQLAREPLAGAVFGVRPGVRGLSAQPYAG